MRKKNFKYITKIKQQTKATTTKSKQTNKQKAATTTKKPRTQKTIKDSQIHAAQKNNEETMKTMKTMKMH